MAKTKPPFEAKIYLNYRYEFCVGLLMVQFPGAQIFGPGVASTFAGAPLSIIRPLFTGLGPWTDLKEAMKIEKKLNKLIKGGLTDIDALETEMAKFR